MKSFTVFLKKLEPAKVLDVDYQSAVLQANMLYGILNVLEVKEDNHSILRPKIFQEIDDERLRQETKWGEQNWPCINNDIPIYNVPAYYRIPSENDAKTTLERRLKKGILTYSDIFIEELAEAIQAKTAKDRREELVQAASVLVAWIEKIDRNNETEKPETVKNPDLIDLIQEAERNIEVVEPTDAEGNLI